MSICTCYFPKLKGATAVELYSYVEVSIVAERNIGKHENRIISRWERVIPEIESVVGKVRTTSVVHLVAETLTSCARKAGNLHCIAARSDGCTLDCSCCTWVACPFEVRCGRILLETARP